MKRYLEPPPPPWRRGRAPGAAAAPHRLPPPPLPSLPRPPPLPVVVVAAAATPSSSWPPPPPPLPPRPPRRRASSPPRLRPGEPGAAAAAVTPRRASSPTAAARTAPSPPTQPPPLSTPLPPPVPAEVTKALATARDARDVAAVLATASEAGCPLDALHAAAALNRLAHVQEGAAAAGRALPSRRPSTARPGTARLLAALAARVASAVAEGGSGFGTDRRRHGRRRAGRRRDDAAQQQEEEGERQRQRQRQQRQRAIARQASGALWALGKYAAVVVAAPEPQDDEQQHTTTIERHDPDDDDDDEALAAAAERALWPHRGRPAPLQASALALAEALLESGGGDDDAPPLKDGNPLDVANAAWALARLQMAAAAESARRRRRGRRAADEGGEEEEEDDDADAEENPALSSSSSSSSPFLDPHRSASWWTTLESLAAERVHDFKTQELVNVAWALAQSRRLLLLLLRSAPSSSPALAAFVRAAAERLSRPETAAFLSPQLVANAAWALARLAPDALAANIDNGGGGDDDPAAAAAAVSPRLLGEAGAALATRGAAVAYRMKAQGISNLLWSLATLRDAASAHLKRQKQRQKQQGQAATAPPLPPPLTPPSPQLAGCVAAIASAAVTGRHVQHMRAQGLSNTLWALQRLAFFSPAADAAYEAGAAARPVPFPPSAAGAAAALIAPPRALRRKVLRACARQALRVLEEFKPLGLVTLLEALADDREADAWRSRQRREHKRQQRRAGAPPSSSSSAAPSSPILLLDARQAIESHALDGADADDSTATTAAAAALPSRGPARQRGNSNGGDTRSSGGDDDGPLYRELLRALAAQLAPTQRAAAACSPQTALRALRAVARAGRYDARLFARAVVAAAAEAAEGDAPVLSAADAAEALFCLSSLQHPWPLGPAQLSLLPLASVAATSGGLPPWQVARLAWSGAVAARSGLSGDNAASASASLREVARAAVRLAERQQPSAMGGSGGGGSLGQEHLAMTAWAAAVLLPREELVGGGSGSGSGSRAGEAWRRLVARLAAAEASGGADASVKRGSRTQQEPAGLSPARLAELVEAATVAATAGGFEDEEQEDAPSSSASPSSPALRPSVGPALLSRLLTAATNQLGRYGLRELAMLLRASSRAAAAAGGGSNNDRSSSPGRACASEADAMLRRIAAAAPDAPPQALVDLLSAAADAADAERGVKVVAADGDATTTPSHPPLSAPYGALAADAAALLHRRLPAAASRAQLAAAVRALLRCGYLPHAPLYRGAARLALGGGGSSDPASSSAALLGSAPLAPPDALQLLLGVVAADAAERREVRGGGGGGAGDAPLEDDPLLAQLLGAIPPGSPERARAEEAMRN